MKNLIVKIIKISFAFLLVTSTRGAPPETGVLNDDPRRKIDLKAAFAHFRDEWKSGNVELVDILHIPTNRYYAINVSSSQMDRGATFRLIFNEPKESSIIKSLAAAIDTVKANSSERVADLRWGFIFSRRKNDRVFSLYFDEAGRRGIVDGACVNFDSDALRIWAEATFGGIFR